MVASGFYGGHWICAICEFVNHLEQVSWLEVRRTVSLPVTLFVYNGISCSSWTTNGHFISPYNLHIFAKLTL